MQFQQIRSATSIVTFAGKRFLIDPMLAPANTYPIVPDAPVCGSGNPTIDLPCTIESLFNVDAIIVTHWHFDHFDEVAMQCLPKNIPLFTQNDEEAALTRAKGFQDVRVLTEDGVTFGNIVLYKTPCDHGRSDLVTEHVYHMIKVTDQASGIVFKSASEQNVFYLAGDTVYYSGVVDTIKKYAPDIIAVNAAGAQAPKGHALIMNEYDIWALKNDFPELKVIATHVEGVSHATVTRQSLKAFAEAKQLDQLYIPDDGMTLMF